MSTPVAATADPVGFTPGPWDLGFEQLRGGVYWVVAIPGTTDSIDLRADDNGEANARLIAAAPDLLAALIEARADIKNGITALVQCREELDGFRNPTSDQMMAQREAMLSRIEAAIAKATGSAA